LDRAIVNSSSLRQRVASGCEDETVRKHYLHLSVFQCSDCSGPVVSGSIAVRENEISKETEVSEVGAICLSCGHRQIHASDGSLARNFPPVLWDPTQPIAARPY
jgi:hypothetical protein